MVADDQAIARLRSPFRQHEMSQLTCSELAKKACPAASGGDARLLCGGPELSARGAAGFLSLACGARLVYGRERT
jgi:hypothetical protein